jgi:hypothetical protein
MPTISAFYGIYIRMYLRDHPPPHFHASYGEFEAFVAIENGEIIEGRLPTVARRLVREWALGHRDELLGNWERARAGQPLERIPGLDND